MVLQMVTDKTDVYKRQRQYGENLNFTHNRFLSLGKGKKVACNSHYLQAMALVKPLRRVRAVSYTHLDVYKRQATR